ncbi:hypothetical protein AAKU55_005020 [Oxalobacteraceae bacterium GrIS 1.11]
MGGCFSKQGGSQSSSPPTASASSSSPRRPEPRSMVEAVASGERKVNWLDGRFDSVGTDSKGQKPAPVFFLFCTNRDAAVVLQQGIIPSRFQDTVEPYGDRKEAIKANFVYAVRFDVHAEKLEMPKLVDVAIPDKMPYQTAYLFQGNGRNFMATSKDPKEGSEVAFCDRIRPGEFVKLTRGKGRSLRVDDNEENLVLFNKFLAMDASPPGAASLNSASSSSASPGPA